MVFMQHSSSAAFLIVRLEHGSVLDRNHREHPYRSAQVGGASPGHVGRGVDKLTSLVYGWSYANIRGQLVREGESRDVPDLTEDCGR